jgi:hypothetical protein
MVTKRRQWKNNKNRLIRRLTKKISMERKNMKILNFEIKAIPLKRYNSGNGKRTHNRKIAGERIL